MTFDPLTGYTLTFVFLGALSLLNFTVYFATGRKRFFFGFCVYQLLWVVTLAGILLQTIVPEIGIPLTNLFVPLSLVALIEACRYESPRIGTWRYWLYGVIVLAHYSLFAYEQLVLHNFVFRSVFNSVVYCVGLMVGLIFALSSTPVDRASRTKGGVVIAVSLGIQIVAWAIRGIATASSAPVTGLLSQGLSATISILALPPLIYLLNAGFLARVIELANKEKDLMTQRALMAEHDAMFVDLLGNLNHELNTPLGNARVGASMLSERVRLDEAPAQVMAGVNRSLDQMAEIIADRNRFLSRDASVPSVIMTEELYQTFSRLMRRHMPVQTRMNFELEPSIGQFRSTWRFVFSVLFVTTEVLSKGIEAVGKQSPAVETDSRVSLRFSREGGNRQAIEVQVRHNRRYLLANAKQSLRSTDRRSIRELLPAEVCNRMTWLAEYLQTPFGGSYTVRADADGGEIIVLSFRESA